MFYKENISLNPFNFTDIISFNKWLKVVIMVKVEFKEKQEGENQFS